MATFNGVGFLWLQLGGTQVVDQRDRMEFREDPG